MKRVRLAALVAAAVLVVGLAALPVQAAGNKVKISNYKFTPASLSVPTGTKVIWTNTAAMTFHSVTAYGGNWTKNTKVLAGKRTNFTFTSPGTYTYYCRFHAHVTAGGVCKPNLGAGNMCGSISVT